MGKIFHYKSSCDLSSSQSKPVIYPPARLEITARDAVLSLFSVQLSHFMVKLANVTEHCAVHLFLYASCCPSHHCLVYCCYFNNYNLETSATGQHRVYKPLCNTFISSFSGPFISGCDYLRTDFRNMDHQSKDCTRYHLKPYSQGI